MSRLLLPKEAALHFRVSTDTLRRWAEEGKIDFEVTVGGHRRYVLSSNGDQASALPKRVEGEPEQPSQAFPALRELEFPQFEVAEEEEPRWRFRLVLADLAAEPELQASLGLAGMSASGFTVGGGLQFADFECDAPTFGEAVGRMIDGVEGVAGYGKVISVERLGALSAQSDSASQS